MKALEMAEKKERFNKPPAKPAFEKAASLPLYQKVHEQLKEHIDRGFWKPGDMLPNEFELGEQFGVSPGTVKQALLNLARDGLIVRQAGKGTFVTRLKGTRGFSGLLRFGDALSGSNPNSVIRVIETRLLDTAPSAVAEALQVPSDQPVIFLRRLLTDDAPICLYDSYLPRDLVPDLGKVPLDQVRLYPALEKHFGIHVVSADEILRADTVHGTEAKLLNLAEGAPVILIDRTAFTHGERVMELRRTIGRSDRFVYQMRLP